MTFSNNLLPKKSLSRKIFYVVSLVLIFVSITLIIYPFLGSLEYRFLSLGLDASRPQNISLESKLNAGDIPFVVVPGQGNDFENITIKEGNEKSVTRGNQQPEEVEVLGVEKGNNQEVPGQETKEEAEAVKEQSEKKIVAPRVIIPKIGVDMVVVEGSNESVLYKGAWRIPGTSTPDKGGNTVISAHRYLYRPPSKKTFYNLDKLAMGDTFTILWQGQEYNYKVGEIKIVEPDQIEILYNTKNSVATLFTCTPLFTSDKRLVIIGDLI